MQINFNQTKSWTITNNNAIGPTDDTDIRSGFDCGAVGTTYNNANTIFIKSDGDDTDNGEFATPVLTLEKAVTLLGGGITKIAFLDADADFDAVVTSAIPASTEIVAADGITPVLKFSYTDNLLRTDYSLGGFSSRGNVVQTSNGAIFAPMRDVNAAKFLLYKSTDKGRNWTEVTPNGAGSDRVSCLIKSPTGDRLLCARNSAPLGIYSSDDYGANWTSEYSARRVDMLIADENSGILYGIDIASVQIIYSIDNGNNWSSYTPTGMTNPVAIIGMSSSGRLFVYGNNVLSYSDNAINNNTWVTVGTFQPFIPEIILSFNNRLFMLVRNTSAAVLPRIFVSDDNGVTWGNLGTPNSMTTTFTTNVESIFLSENGELMYFIAGDQSADNIELHTTTDGITFSKVWSSTDYGTVGIGKDSLATQIANNLYFNGYSGGTFTVYRIPVELFDISNNSIVINGCYLSGDDKGYASASGTGEQTGFNIKYCEVLNTSDNAFSKIADITSQYNFIHDLNTGISDISGVLDIQDSIFSNIDDIAIDSLDNTPVVEHCTFYDCGTGFYNENNTLVSISLKNNIFYNCTTDMYVVDNSFGATYDYSITGGEIINLTPTINTYDDVDPLFVSTLGDDYNLQSKAGGYFINSIGIDFSDDNRDCGAWDVSRSYTEEWDSFIVEDPPAGSSIDIEAQNLVSNIDILGNIRESYDAIKRQFTFDFSDYVRRNQTFQLYNLFQDTQAMKLYPIGVSDSILSDVTEGAINWTDMEIIINPAEYMPINWYSGWWISVLIDSAYLDFYINSNTENTFTIENKLNYSLPANGTYDIVLNYILVKLVHNSINMTVDYFINFSKGTSLYIADGETAGGQSYLEQYNKYKLIFKEVDNFSI